jgi:hypothetical protein
MTILNVEIIIITADSHEVLAGLLERGDVGSLL